MDLFAWIPKFFLKTDLEKLSESLRKLAVYQAKKILKIIQDYIMLILRKIMDIFTLC